MESRSTIDYNNPTTLKNLIGVALADVKDDREQYLSQIHGQPTAFREAQADNAVYFSCLKNALETISKEVDNNHIPTQRLASVFRAVENLQAAEDKKVGSKEFHRFVSKLSAEKVGKSLMVAVRGLAAAAITVFTLGFKKEVAKSLVQTGVEQVKSRKMLAESLRMFGTQYKEVYNVDRKPRPMVIA